MVLGISVTGVRRALVWAAATVVAAMLEAGLVPVLGEAATAAREGSRAALPFDDALVWGSAAVAAAVTAWLWLVTTMVTADALRGRPPRRRRGVPEGLRRAVLVLGGAAVTSGLAAPALAGGGAPGPEVLVGLRLPERVGVAPHVVASPSSGPSTRPAAHIVVSPGDSLWSIAADHLGPETTAEEIALAWPRLYAANRDVIGPDPAVIQPGQHLIVPPLLPEGDGRVLG
jgi:hypothetical protein